MGIILGIIVLGIGGFILKKVIDKETQRNMSMFIKLLLLLFGMMLILGLLAALSGH